jgi:hypothetical protein
MFVHQAVYGAAAGHALLKTSDAKLASEFKDLAWRTDLPQTCPNGVTWAPFFRLIKEAGWMMLIHTRKDETAGRGGMVFSRAAFIRLDDVEVLGDLLPIAAVLASPWAEGEPLEPIELDVSIGAASALMPSKGAAALAALLSHAGRRPIVTRQEHGLEEAMFDLWRRAPPESRITLTFGLSFGPDDVNDLSVVCTPEALLSRWNQAQVVDLDTAVETGEHAATILDAPIDVSARDFAKQTSLRLDSPTSIAIAVQAAELWHHESTPDGDLLLLRTLVERAGNSPCAEAAKSAAAKRVLTSATSWSVDDVLAMRNLDFSGLGEAPALSNALRGWVKDKSSSSQPNGLREVLTAWVSEKPKPVWLAGAEAGFRAAGDAKMIQNAGFGAVWQLLMNTDPARAPRLLSLLDDASHEKDMLDAAGDQFPVDRVDALLPDLCAKGWWQLAGTLLGRSRSPRDAVVAALAAAPSVKASRQALLAGALSQATEIELVDVAIAVQEAVVTEMAAQACVRCPEVLTRFDWKRFEWFLLFREAFAISPGVIDALPDRAVGLSQTIAAQMAVESLWAVVASTPLADIVDVHERARAWDLIPKPHVETILDATARGWLVRFELGQQRRASTEPRLAATVLAIVNRPGYLIDALRRAPASLPFYLESFSFASDREVYQFLMDLSNSDLRLGEAAAKALGQAIHANQWTQAAKDAKSLLNSRLDLFPMYRECYRQLGPVDRLLISCKLGLPPALTVEEAWEAFEAEAVELYPMGPWHDELWSRSGGKNEDLVNEGTGRASWHRCVRSLRNGMPPGAEAVLHVMAEQYYYNDTLQQLQRQRFWR